jgi:hypothetical protein
MAKTVTIFLMLALITTPLVAEESLIEDMDREHSKLLAISSIFLFLGIKNSLVAAAEDGENQARVVFSALSFQAFITFFSLAFKD